MSYFLVSVISLLLNVFLGGYAMLVLMRFLLQWVRADYHNPLVQALTRLTNRPLLPLRRVIPGLWGIDCAALVLAFALALVFRILLGLVMGKMMGLLPLMLMAGLDVLRWICYLLFVALILWSLSSWLGSTQPFILALLRQLTQPILRPFARFRRSGLDFSPLFASVALMIVILFINALELTVAGF